ncbi:hypothetical protein ACROYT_G030297 [Oculina patagonica]
MALTSLILAILIFIASLLALAFVSFSLYVFYQHWRYRHIPGPARDGFFTGNVPFVRKERKRVLGRGMSDIWFKWHQEYGSVYITWIYHIPVVILSDPDTAKKALVTLSLPKAYRLYSLISFVFGQRGTGKGILTEIDHEIWRRKRAMLNPAFHRKYLMNLMDSFNSVGDEFLEKLDQLADGKTPVRMADEFARVTLDIIGKVGYSINLGTIANPDSEFPSAVSKMLQGIQASAFNPFWKFDVSMFPFQNSVINAIKFLRRFATKVIEERCLALRNGEETPKDILEHILNEAKENTDVDMESMVDNFLTIFIAGQETTSNQLSFTLYEILRHPEIEERILEEIEEVLGCRHNVEYEDLGKLQYLDQTLKESLRIHPPVGFTQRIVQKEENFGGYKIPAKTCITVPCYTIHKSTKFWENPDVFDPGRFSPGQKENISQSKYFPFSLGPRTCIGKTLAQFEAKVLMARVLRQFKFELLPGQTAQVEEALTLKPRDGVICTITPRK